VVRFYDKWAFDVEANKRIKAGVSKGCH